MKATRRTPRLALKRCIMAISYRTVAGYEVLAGSIQCGTQDRVGGPVEVYISETNERLCFTARECGLPTA